MGNLTNQQGGTKGLEEFELHTFSYMFRPRRTKGKYLLLWQDLQMPPHSAWWQTRVGSQQYLVFFLLHNEQSHVAANKIHIQEYIRDQISAHELQ